jgi:hypothetical protein
LDDAVQHELPDIGRGSTQKRSQREDGDARRVVIFAAEASGQPTVEGHDDDGCQDVAGRDPADLVDGGAKRTRHVGECHIDNRRVDDCHDQTQHRGERDEKYRRFGLRGMDADRRD